MGECCANKKARRRHRRLLDVPPDGNWFRDLTMTELDVLIDRLVEKQRTEPDNRAIASALYAARMERGDYARAAHVEIAQAIRQPSVRRLARSLVYFNSYSKTVARVWLGLSLALGAISWLEPLDAFGWLSIFLAVVHGLVYLGARDLVLVGSERNRLGIVIYFVFCALVNFRTHIG